MSIWLVIIWFIFGALAATLAKQKGRNPIAWFFIGLAFGIFGLAFIFFAPKIEPDAAKQTTEPPALAPFPKSSLNDPVLFWYYLDKEDKQHGPMSASAFESAKASGQVSSSTFVWNTEMDNWKKLAELTPQT